MQKQIAEPSLNRASVSRGISHIARDADLGELRINFVPWQYILGTARNGSALLRGPVIGMVLLFIFIQHPSFGYSIFTCFEVILVLLSVLLIILGWFELARHVWHASSWEQGLIVRQGWRPPAVIRWDEIESYRYLSVFPSHIIQCQNGSAIRVATGMHNEAKFLHEVGEQVKAHFLPATLAAYEAGQTLTFDVLSLSKAGLSFAGETIPWYRVKELDAKRIKEAVLVSIAQNSQALVRPLRADDIDAPVRKALKEKSQMVIRTRHHLLLTSHLPNFSIILALLEHACASQPAQ